MRAQPDARAALAFGLLAVGVFVTLAVLVMTPLGTAFDGAVLEGVKRTDTPPVVAVMGLLTRLGNEFIVGALPLVLLWRWRRRLRQQAAEVLIATLGAQLLNDALSRHLESPEYAQQQCGRRRTRSSGIRQPPPTFYRGRLRVGVFAGSLTDTPPAAVWIAVRKKRYERSEE